MTTAKFTTSYTTLFEVPQTLPKMAKATWGSLWTATVALKSTENASAVSGLVLELMHHLRNFRSAPGLPVLSACCTKLILRRLVCLTLLMPQSVTIPGWKVRAHARSRARARACTHTHAQTHTHRGTGTHDHTDYTKLKHTHARRYARTHTHTHTHTHMHTQSHLLKTTSIQTEKYLTIYPNSCFPKKIAYIITNYE